MRFVIIVLSLLWGWAAPAAAQLSLSFGMPGLSIGINVPDYPQLVRVPGHPVYYAPDLQTNFFFYDSLYWVYQNDDWYASDWYDGPWDQVSPDAVPLFVLRVPVRYYRSPPVYFRGWRADAPPRWGDHWGNDWHQRHTGWDRWNRNAAPAPAPLPRYQRLYRGERYPQPEQQHRLRDQNYRYQPREAVVREHLRARPAVRVQDPQPGRDWRDARPDPQPRQRGPDRRGEPPPPVVTPLPRQPHAGPAERDRSSGRGRPEQGKGRDDDDDKRGDDRRGNDKRDNDRRDHDRNK